MRNVSKLKTLLLVGALLGTAACRDEQKSETSQTTAAAESFPAATAKGDSTTASPAAGSVAGTEAAPSKVLTPFRTFVTVQRYTLEKSGNAAGSISNARIDITFPNGGKLPLPEGGQFWPIGDGQVQEINRTYEIPWNLVQQDGFKFKIQMVRKGSPMNPCEFDVRELSQFNRTYVCKTDVGWQAANGIPEDRQALEGLQARVFSDTNSDPQELPREAIAAHQ